MNELAQLPKEAQGASGPASPEAISALHQLTMNLPRPHFDLDSVPIESDPFQTKEPMPLLPSPGPQRGRTISHCHKKMKEVALGLAEQNYSELMSASNFVFEEWKRQHPGMPGKALERAFVKKVLGGSTSPRLGPFLTKMLSEPIDESLKEEIVEALVPGLDPDPGKGPPWVLAGTVQAKN